MIIRTKTTIDHHIPSGKITSPIYAKLSDWVFGKNGIEYVGKYYVIKETIQQEQKDAVLDQDGFEIEPAQQKVSKFDKVTISSFNESMPAKEVNELFKQVDTSINSNSELTIDLEGIVNASFLNTYQTGDYFNQPLGNWEIVNE